MMRFYIVGAILGLAVTAAVAADIAVSDADQKNILGICDIASRTPEQIPREARHGIAGFCLDWQRRMEKAQSAPAAPETKK